MGMIVLAVIALSWAVTASLAGGRLPAIK